MYVYCLFCDVRRCNGIALYLEKHGFERSFTPKILKHQRKNGVNKDVVFDLLPGYVFAYSKEALTDFSWIRRLNGVIRLLGEAEKNCCLGGHDLAFGQKLRELDGFISPVNLVRVGDKLCISDDVFQENNGKILMIDYRKKRVKIAFSFAGTFFQTWVACEIIKND